MHAHFQIPFALISYGIIFSAILIYGVKTNASWVCKVFPAKLCQQVNPNDKSYKMGNSNLYLVFFLFLFMFFVHYQCYTEAYPYYTFFMLSAVAIIISFFYIGMQLLVLGKNSYWVLNLFLVMALIFGYSIAHLISLQPPA
ncbi:MAG: hypothetical protein HKO56_08305 [Bacteroidia bacterium]|nr:hypothetical protein [Bacteroidia bacterium]NNC85584.1 hypothetical protein [Bacteroidia bacterium]NNM16645.1 hypothetical protein [Bacteroidia bacterium]